MPHSITRRRLQASFVALVAIVPWVAARGAPCPQSSIGFIGGTTSSATAARDTSAANYFEPGSGRGAYDLLEGWILAEATAPYAYAGYGRASVEAVDDFRVVGLAAGTPVTLRVQLPVTGEIEGRSRILFGIRRNEGDQPEAQSTDLLGPPPEITIRVYAGKTFQLATFIEAISDAGFVSGRGSITFLDLEPGAAVVSCQGYTSDPTVPTLQATWGRLKARYR